MTLCQTKVTWPQTIRAPTNLQLAFPAVNLNDDGCVELAWNWVSLVVYENVDIKESA